LARSSLLFSFQRSIAFASN